MTIYAIVNNILSASGHDAGIYPVWGIISASGILQGGNPYFMPDFADRFEARIAVAIRIGKLGKGIAPRFVYRYVDGVAPAVLFVAPDLIKSLRNKGLPWAQAISYDRCLSVGKFTPYTADNLNQAEVMLTFDPPNDSSEIILKGSDLIPGIEETLTAISRENTLKMGDIILIGLAGTGPQVTPDMRAHLSLNGFESLRFNIR